MLHIPQSLAIDVELIDMMMPFFFILSESIKFVRKGNRLYALSKNKTHYKQCQTSWNTTTKMSIDFYDTKERFSIFIYISQFCQKCMSYYNIIKTETMDDGKGKKDVYSKRTTHFFFLKYTKIQNRPFHNTTNWIFRKIKRPRCKANDTYKFIFFTINL